VRGAHLGLSEQSPALNAVDLAAATGSAQPAAQQNDLPAVAPVRFEERIFALDAIRGFALLGILVMNICWFGLPESAYFIPVPAGGSTGINLLTWCFTFVFADGKMRAIFSLAFGASVCLLIERLTRKGAAADAADIHYRRMLWLLLFGFIHAYFLWSGEILFIYAMMGLILYPLRKLSPRALLIAAAILMFAWTGEILGDYFHLKTQQRDMVQIQADEHAGKKLTKEQEDTKNAWEDTVKNYNPSPDDLKDEIDAHRGSYLKLFAFRAKDVYREHSHPIYDPEWWFDVLAMMLAGMALLKLGVLAGNYSTKFYLWMALISFTIGLPSHIFMAWWLIKQHFDIVTAYLAFTFYEVGRFTAFGYIAVLMLIIKSGKLQTATKTLAAVGQMAFSNYILTTLICTTIFEGYGFGLFNKLQRHQLYGIVLAVWLVILIISPIWLRHFRFGPLEWLWRSLTYWKKQPFRRNPVPVA
jgi:uncharacterized protein